MATSKGLGFIVFTETYNGESICDINRDVSEAMDEHYNGAMKAVPVDEYGLSLGTFTITITWNGDSLTPVERALLAAGYVAVPKRVGEDAPRGQIGEQT